MSRSPLPGSLRTTLLALGIVLASAGLVAAGLRTLYTGSLIKPLLPGPQGAACFTGSYRNASVDIEDWTKARQLPSGRLRSDGQPQMVTVFDRDAAVPVTQFRLRLDTHTGKSSTEWTYAFTLVGHIEGQGVLTARGACPWSDRDTVETPVGRIPAGAFSLACSIDCDGGTMQVTRNIGTPTLDLDFGRQIGLTMKSGCGSDGGRIRVRANARGQTFALAPAPAELCAELKGGL